MKKLGWCVLATAVSLMNAVAGEELSLAGWWMYAPMQLIDEHEATRAAAASGKP